MLILTCAMQKPPNELRPTNACAGGSKPARDNDRPIVCVDDSASVLSVSPDPIVLHDVMSTDRSTPGAIQWFTRSGNGDLQIRFRNTECVKSVRCNDGHCTAVAAKKLPKQADEVRCKYDVLLTGHPTLDPETVLTGCCVDVAPSP
ncbi:MAG TPA: hypothetical protein VEU30_02020 [Thermoanaerobaculia bacterium]|nr:hypothetical protein [Thermoanaerobaculia bacterium]